MTPPGWMQGDAYALLCAKYRQAEQVPEIRDAWAALTNFLSENIERELAALRAQLAAAEKERDEANFHHAEAERLLAEKIVKCGQLEVEVERAAARGNEGLLALLEGLECEETHRLVNERPDILRAVGVEIAKAAKLGAHLYATRKG